jgi:hypothetical protein
MATGIKQDDFIKTALRLPRNLHAAIQSAAERSGRSMNAEIIAILESSFRTDTALEELTRSVKRMERQMAAQALDTVMQRMNATGVGMLLAELVSKLEPSLESQDHPFAKTLALYKEAANRVLKEAEPKLQEDLKNFSNLTKPLIEPDDK